MNSSEFFNMLDYIYIGIMLLSALVGLFRGFSRDFFGTCAWIFSGFLSVFAAPVLYKPVGQYITDELLLRGVCLVMAFLMLLAIFLLMTGLISSKVKESVFSGVDRAAGALFGLIRGMFVVFSIFIMLLVFEVPRDRFAIVKDSKISTVLYSHAKDIVAFMEKIKLVPKGYINRIHNEPLTQGKAQSVRGLVPEIITRTISEHVSKSNNTNEKKGKTSTMETQQEAPRGYLSLSEAIEQRRKEASKKTIQKSIGDDREAD